MSASDDDVERARRLLRGAIESTAPKVGRRVDKYFGTKLPPVCARLGCYITDDGKRFYCINSSCQKHKKRATKHSKIRRKGDGPSYFHCPHCGSRNVDLTPMKREYRCRSCRFEWPVNP